ncbi:DnaJ domain [Pseudocohnilembus persalinus]|uniref:DnaJ domain n=1 Tax=Pseudocohnilembus persalinus TaxID=266149 RepID=A0A0V0R700_PSEPJ|nr:DnaJ domain [Pseudocohnilembus persalinus]|eukprot:KRX10122.1 DnaJ domain [Pseudocohnilembus persalinus]
MRHKNIQQQNNNTNQNEKLKQQQNLVQKVQNQNNQNEQQNNTIDMFVQSEEQLKFISTSNNSINEQVELISEQLESSIELVEEPTIFINEKLTKNNNNSRKSIEDKIQIQNSSNKNESDIKQNSLPNIKILPTWRTLQSQTNVQNIGSSSIKKSKNQNNQINQNHNQQNLEQYQNIKNIESSENQQQIDFQKQNQQIHKNEVQTNSSQKSKATNKIYHNDCNQFQNQQNFVHYINSDDSLFKDDHFCEDFSKIQEEIYKQNSELSKQQHQIFQDDHDKNQSQIKSDNQLNNQQQKQVQEEQNKILSDSSLVQVSKSKTGRSNKLDIEDLDKQIFTQDELDYDNTLSIFTVLRKIKNNADIDNQKIQMKEYEEYLKEKIKENFQNSVQNFSEIQREKCAGQQITDSVETSNYSISGFQDVFGDLQNKQMKYVKELQELKQFKHQIQKQQTQKSQFNENQFLSEEELSIKQSENHQKQNQAKFESSIVQSQEQNFYEVLGIEKNASQQEIKKQFRKLAHLYHPDKIEEQADKEEAQQKFVQMTEAFEILKDEKERKVYDDFLNNDKKGGHQAYLEYKKKGGKGAGFRQQQQQQGFHGFKNFEDFFGSFFDDTNIFGQDDEMFGFGHRHFGRKGSGFESIFEGMGMGMGMNMGGSFSSSSSTTFTMGGISKSTQKIQQADGTILIRETTIDQNGNKEVKESIQQGGQQRESIEGGFGGMEMRNNRQGRRSIFDMFDL